MLNLYPVYLVSPETMDKCSPPELMRGVNPHCVKEIIPSVRSVLSELPEEPEGERLDDLLNLVERRLKECSRSYVNLAMGVFLPHGCKNEGIAGPVILITPERVEDEANKISNEYSIAQDDAFKSLFKAVLSHELGHAYSYAFSKSPAVSGYSSSLGLRTVEETIAQLFAYLNINENDRMVMTLESKEQSAEYRAWYLLSDFAEDAIKTLLDLYDCHDQPLFLDNRKIEKCLYLLHDCLYGYYPHCYRFYKYCCANASDCLQFLCLGLRYPSLGHPLTPYLWALWAKASNASISGMLKLFGLQLLITSSLIEPKP